MALGILDVGTNSIHLLIGMLDRRTFHVILTQRDLARLGEGGLAMNRLTPVAMRRATRVLRRYAATLTRYGVDHVDAVATSAVRDASNGQAFVRHVRATLRLPLRVISGREEARLIALGVLQARRTRDAAVIVTIGGGSAQVICGDAARLRYVTSVPLGAARLAQRFIRHDPPQREEIDALGRHVRRVWAPVARAVRRHRWRHALGSSATISQCMQAAAQPRHWAMGGAREARRRHDRWPLGHRLKVTQSSLRRFTGWLATSTAKERARLPGLDPRREALALPTSLALLIWMERCRVPMLEYAPGSLREGLIVTHVMRQCRRGSTSGAPLVRWSRRAGVSLGEMTPQDVT